MKLMTSGLQGATEASWSKVTCLTAKTVRGHVIIELTKTKYFYLFFFNILIISKV